MKVRNGDGFIVKVAGLGVLRNAPKWWEENTILFHPGPCRCGLVQDGVSIDVGHGGIVIPFDELHEMYFFALRARMK